MATSNRNEYRTDPLTGQTAYYASSRMVNPIGTATKQLVEDSLQPCVFCPAHSTEIASDVETDSQGNWRIRSFANRAPHVSPDAHAEPAGSMFRSAHPALGKQEIVVTTAEHGKNWPQFSDEEAVRALLFLQRRGKELADPRWPYIFYTINIGAQAGQTQPHAHAHVVETSIEIDTVALERAQNLKFQNAKVPHSSTVIEAERDYEKQRRDLVVLESETLTAWVPYASLDSGEVRICANNHETRFEDSPRQTVVDAAIALRNVIGGFTEPELGVRSFNVMIHSSPAGDLPNNQWHIHVSPNGRGIISAGITGNTVWPDVLAPQLRDAISSFQNRISLAEPGSQLSLG